MKQSRKSLCASFALCLMAPAGLAQAITLDLPEAAVASAGKTENLGSYALPVGPFADGVIPSRMVEGTFRQTAWRVDVPGMTTLELLRPLRAQLAQEGFSTVFECEAATCGGFDFRYATSVLPEPEMHVDLGDYRFFAAERGAEVVSLMISRTAAAGFVQLVHVGGSADLPPVLTASTKTATPPGQAVALSAPTLPKAPPQTDDLGERLMSGGAMALDDLVFASGTSSLAEGDYPSLRALADWLAQNPDQTVALVGHTDASGGLEGNITLSRKRAEAVRMYLTSALGVSPDQVEAQGVGYLSPRMSNLTEDGRKKNRRVEVILTSTQVAP